MEFKRMLGVDDEAKLLNQMGYAINDMRHELISTAMTYYDPKITAYVGTEQWKALHSIDRVDTQRSTYIEAGELQWLGVRIIRVMKDNYFRLVETK